MSQHLKGRLFAVTGTLLQVSELRAERGLRHFGSLWTRQFSARVDTLILGHAPTPLLLEKARLHGIQCITEEKLIAFLQGDLSEKQFLASETNLDAPTLNNSDALSHMRALVYQTPSPKIWEALCELLDRLDDCDVPFACDYLRDHTAYWPHGLELYEWRQIKDEVELCTAPPTWRARLLKGQKIAGGSLIRALRYPGMGLGDELATSLLKAPGLDDLRLLDLSDNVLSEDFFRALGRTQNFPALTHVNLSFNHKTPNAAAHIAEGDALSSLTHLTLRSTWLEPQGCATLADSKHWPALTFLDLRGNKLRDEGLRELARAHFLPHLTHLNLSDTALQDEGLPLFLHEGRPEAIEVIDLSHNHLGSASGEALAQAHCMRNLTHLSLKNSRLGAESGLALMSASHLRSLRHLDLYGNAMGGAALVALLHTPWSANLEHLDLGENALDTTQVVQWIDSSPMSKLRFLNLSHNALGDRVAMALARRETFTPTVLDLGNTRLTDQGFHALLKAPHLKNAERLRLPWKLASRETLRTFADAPHINAHARIECGLELMARRKR